jgi:hypothetical protein
MSLNLTASAQEKPQPPVGPIASDIRAEALWDGRKLVPFKALDNPKMVKASEADFLDDGEYVLGMTVNGESRAYATRYAWFHHIINDDIGGKPVAITYCSVCNTGIGYDRMLEGRKVDIDFYGLYNAVVVLCERQTSSVLLQVDGRFVTGSLLGKRLEPHALLDTTWGNWKKLHPNTLVMSPENDFSKFYRPKGMNEIRGYDRFPRAYFNQSLTRADKRLPAFDKVLGVELPGVKGREDAIRRAYPIKALTESKGALNDTLAGKPVTVFLELDTTTASAFSRLVDGKVLTFEGKADANGKLAFFDKETGSRWNIVGKAEEGPLAGKSLTVVENHLSQWYGWSAYFPETTIYGRTDAPQPVDPKTISPQPPATSP